MGSLTKDSTTLVQTIGLKMKNLFLVLFSITLLRGFNSYSVLESDSQGDAIKCYSCNSLEGECDDENYGVEKDCDPGHGCYISQETPPGGKKMYTRDCAQAENEEDLCDEMDEEGGSTKTCHCSTNLCNKNWIDAGSTDKPKDPTEEPKSVKCYTCNSNEGDCSEDQPGVEEDCVGGFGCLISRERGGEDGNEVFIRACLALAVEGEYACETISENGVTVQTCQCPTELCNRNWVEAGSTESPTEPPVEKIKCYSCDSNDEECDDDHPGTETDCDKKFGCNISLDKNLYTRGCSVNEEPNCIIEADTRSCDCQTPLCNKNWNDAGAEEKIKCYSCDSDAGDCDDSHAGTEIDCKKEAGCVISKDVAGVYMRGCSGEVEPDPGCNNEDNATTCFCKTNLCNFNWEDAGSTTSSGSDTTKSTPAGPKLQCYQCDSTAGECSDDSHGTEVECPEAKGCTISKTTGSDGSVFRRDCSNEKDVICDTIDDGEGQGTTQFCNCDTSLCNADWSTAGSTHSPPDTTHDTHTTQGDTTITTPAPGAATTLHYSSLIATLATLSFML